MIYTNRDKSRLPYIQDLVNMIDRHTRSMPVRHVMPFDHAVDGNDKFLLNSWENKAKEMVKLYEIVALKVVSAQCRLESA